MAHVWASPTSASSTRVGIGVCGAAVRRSGRGKPQAQSAQRARVRPAAARDATIEDGTSAFDRSTRTRDDDVAGGDGAGAPVERVIDGEERVKATRTIKTRAKTGEETSTSVNARASRRRNATTSTPTPTPVTNGGRVKGAVGRRRAVSSGERWAKAKKDARGTASDTSTRLDSDEEAELCAAIKELLRLERLEELMKDEDETARLEEVAAKGAIEVLAERERFAKEIKRAREIAWASRAGYNSVVELRAAIRAGKMARKKLVQRNMGLAARVGIKLFHQVSSSDKGTMTQQDFVHEGAAGLIRASEKFDPSKGYKFSTYANAWIWQTAMRGMYANGRVIRLPDHVQNKKQQAVKQMNLNDGTIPVDTSSTVSSPSKVEFTVQKLQELDQLCAVPLSLDVTGRSGDVELYDADISMFENANGGVEMMMCDVEREFVRDDLRRAFETLAAKEQYVLKHRFGLVGEPQSLSTVAKAMNMSGEGVRYIEQQALKKLKFEEQQGFANLLSHLDRTNDKPSDEVEEPPLEAPKKRGRKKGGKNKPKPQQENVETTPTVSALDLVRSINF